VQVQAIAAYSELANVFSKSDFLCAESNRGKANVEVLKVSACELIKKLEGNEGPGFILVYLALARARVLH
jgi:hypothetical protein